MASALETPARTLSALWTDAPEEAFAAGSNYAERKRIGQVFTPSAVADFMAAWLLADDGVRRVLDPAVGLGIFLRRLVFRDPNRDWQLVGSDIDLVALDAARGLFAALDLNADLRVADFLDSTWGETYDGIICNPPYLKFHDFPDRLAVVKRFSERLGRRLSGLTNIHVLFLLKSLAQLQMGGRLAYIMPAEFMNAGYGNEIKRLLLESSMLRYVIVFEPDERVFTEATTTSAILLAANDGEDLPIQFGTCRHVSELETLAQRIADSGDGGAEWLLPARRSAEIEPHRKWRAYYNPGAHDRSGLLRLGDRTRVKRGIATGANGYFALSRSKADELDLPPEVLVPCLTKATQAPQPSFTVAQFEQLTDADAPVFLFDASRAPEHDAVKRYIAAGEAEEIDQRYLTRHRSPWHSIEPRPAAPILVTVFSRGGIRFVRNTAGVRNLTCFHGLYLDGAHADDPSLLMAYLITPLAREFLDEERRDYGGGLEKFEPNDLNRAPMLDLSQIPDAERVEILSVWESIEMAVDASEPFKAEVALLDQMFRSFDAV